MDTNRQALGQLIVCKGCCCGRTDRGRPDVPVEHLKSIWQEAKLNRSIHLTVSGCLGPCDVPNVALILSPDSSDWFGRISGDEAYTALVDWARDCHAAGEFLPPPAALVGHRLDRFRPTRPGPAEAGPRPTAG
ncbi:MAG: cobalt chelatase [Gemmataceae bacterium]|nr:cobalt chelatase [Gemmataceae bacterium]